MGLHHQQRKTKVQQNLLLILPSVQGNLRLLPLTRPVSSPANPILMKGKERPKKKKTKAALIGSNERVTIAGQEELTYGRRRGFYQVSCDE